MAITTLLIENEYIAISLMKGISKKLRVLLLSVFLGTEVCGPPHHATCGLIGFLCISNRYKSLD